MSENAQNMEVVDTVANDNMESVISETGNDAIDADLTWDNIEEAAPLLEDANNGDNDDWDSLGESESSSEESSEESKTDDSGETGEESSEEASEADSKDSDNSEQDKSGEEESGEENREQQALNEEQEIEVKIDGETQKISIKELKNNYSGKVAYDKKFSELDRERQAYKAEVEEINSYVSDLGKTMKEASILEGFYKVGELVGMAPHNLKQALINELVPEIGRLQNLSQDEVDLEYKKQELDYNKNKYEADQAKMQKEQAHSELQKTVDSVREANSINDSEWDDAIKYLDEHLPAEEAITPELVGKYVNFERAGTRADELLGQFDASLKDNKDVFNSLQDSIYENPSLTNEDFVELLEEAYGKAKVEKVEKAIEEKASKKLPKDSKKEEKKGTQPEMIDDSEALDWDDIL